MCKKDETSSSSICLICTPIPFSYTKAFRQTPEWEKSQKVLHVIMQEHEGELVLSSPGDSIFYGGWSNNENR
jgi:hypothetical protein